jgi:putative glutamine amidotransferase
MYAGAVQDAGGVPVKVDLDLPARKLVCLARECRGVLLPGSPADVDPKRYGRERIGACATADLPREETDRMLLDEAFAAGKPVLGVCYGAQSINVWRGGTLIQDLAAVPVNHGAGSSVAVAHTAMVLPGSRLYGLVDAGESTFIGQELQLAINSSHHQAIEQLGAGLGVVAVSAQDGVVEAIEGLGDADSPAFLLGMQWHPERSVGISRTSRAVFSGFLEAVEIWERELATRGR